MTRLWTVGAFDDAATPFELRIGGLLDTIELLIDRADGIRIPSFDDCLRVPWPHNVADRTFPDHDSSGTSAQPRS